MAEHVKTQGIVRLGGQCYTTSATALEAVYGGQPRGSGGRSGRRDGAATDAGEAGGAVHVKTGEVVGPGRHFRPSLTRIPENDLCLNAATRSP